MIKYSTCLSFLSNPLPCLSLIRQISKISLHFENDLNVNEKINHALYREFLKYGLFKAFVVPVNIVPQTVLYTHRDENRRKHSLPYQNYSTNTGSCTQWKPASRYSIFWLVSQHCYNALLCIRAFFLTHINVKDTKPKDVSSLYSCSLLMDLQWTTFVFPHWIQLMPECARLIWTQQTSL